MPGEFLSITEELPQALDPKTFLAHFMVEFGIYLNDHKTGIAVVCYLISLCSALKAQSIEVERISEDACLINIARSKIEIPPNPIQKWVILFFELGYRFLKELLGKKILIVGFSTPIIFEIVITPHSFLLTQQRVLS